MTTLTLTRQAVQEKNRTVKFPRVAWKTLYLIGAALLLTMLVFYVYLVNQLTGGSYLIKNYHREISSLETKSKVLQTNFAESGFLGNVQEKMKELNFEKTTQVTYVQLAGNPLGMAR